MSDDLIVPDTKDWTWVTERACPECGLDPGEVAVADLGAAVRRNAVLWPGILAGPGVRERARDRWSPLEYACHVRDVHRVFGGRLALMLAEDDPGFANWDQDAAAVAGRYGEQDPATVGRDLVAGAEAVAEAYDRVPADGWARRGFRSNGSVFTVASIGRYHLHDAVHHVWDVTAG